MFSAIISLVWFAFVLLIGWVAIAIGAAFLVSLLLASVMLLVSIAKMYWRTIKWVCEDDGETY